MPTRAELEQEQQDLRVCQQILQRGSKSFAFAGRLLPVALHEASAGLYAFCREADDAIDEAESPAQGLARLSRRVDAIYRGAPESSPVDRTFARLVSHHRLPRPIVDGLIEGFAWDVERRRYDSLAGLLGYCARVASSVGVLMTLILGERRPSMLARAADLGLAMQLTNIARDVGVDARAGRLYLPLDLLSAQGIDPAGFSADPRHTPQLATVVGALLDAADGFYRRADDGILGLPLRVRLGIGTARLVYAAIGDRIRAAGADSVSQRHFVPGWRKLLLAGRALGYLRGGAAGGLAPPEPSTAFLLEAVAGRGNLHFRG